MMKSRFRSLRYGLESGLISSIFRDKINRQVVCYTDLGCFYGAYSYSYYNKVYNSLLSPITLKILSDV